MILARRLRKELRKRYAQGRDDALTMGNPNPFLPSEWDCANDIHDIARWAYDCGFRDGNRRPRGAARVRADDERRPPPPAPEVHTAPPARQGAAPPPSGWSSRTW